jgi:hypothetical protein
MTAWTRERLSNVAKRVVLHIGTMKSGTSFVQSALMENPAALEAGGVRYLGGTFGRQAKAVRDVYQSPSRRQRHARWRALADEAQTFDGETGVVSMEFLSFAEDRQLGVLLDPFAGVDVDVVLTVRDQFRAIPAQWQTFTRNFGKDGWERYLRRIDASSVTPRGRTRAATSFRRSQDVGRILDRWSGDPRVASVSVVTVPPPDAARDELWTRFCDAARISIAGADLDQTKENVSLGYASCDFLRRLNAHLSEVKPRFYRQAMRPVAREALAPLRDSESRPELDQRGAELARDLNGRIRDAVSRGGFRLVGSFDDLPVPDDVGPREPVQEPDPALVRRAGLAARRHTLEGLGRASGPPPDDLDRLVAEVATLLGIRHGWGL